MHRDKCVLHGKLDQFGMKCYICDSKSHLAENCSKTHYVAKDDMILETFKEENPRAKGFERRFKPKFKASTQYRNVAREASNEINCYYRIHETLF